MRAAILLAACGVLAATPRDARSQPVAWLDDGRQGEIAFSSSTPSGPEQFLQATSPQATVVGTLLLPASAGPVPAVVLAHSAGGVSPSHDFGWAQRFVQAGMAAFVVDSFGPRGVTGFANQPSVFASVADAFAALGLLRTHPRIDPERIVIMGFSRGGSVALLTALDPVRRAGIGEQAGFAAHIAFYPACNLQYRTAAVAAAPILMLLGASDDQAPPGPCWQHAAWLGSRGARIRVEEYPGAPHLFDGADGVQLIEGASSVGDCVVTYDMETRTARRGDTVLGREDVTAYFRSCQRRGVHVGGNEAARGAAQRSVSTFLDQVLARSP